MNHQRLLSHAKLLLPEQAGGDDGVIAVHTLAGQQVPEREWLVPDLIPRAAVTLLSGDGGTGKSLLAMQLMSAGALGRKWLGFELPHFASLGLFCEDDADELQRRQTAINAHLGCRFAELAGMHLWPRAGEDSVLLRYPRNGGAPRCTDLFVTLEELVRKNRVGLIVIDTAADVFGGHENVRGEVRLFIQRLHGLAAIANAAVLLTAHPSITGKNSGSGLSGSTAWNNSVRSRLYLSRPHDSDGDVRELRVMKSNYGPAGARLRLRWQAGVFVQEDPSAISREADAHALAQKFAELVGIATLRGLDLSPNFSSLYAPNVLAGLPEAQGLSSKALAIGMHRALKDELVGMDVFGPASKQRRRLVPLA